MYSLIFNQLTGKVPGIRRLSDGAFIPLADGNADYQDFLKWNAEQDTPLDLDSTIPVIPPEPARDLLKELDSIKVEVGKLWSGKVDKV